MAQTDEVTLRVVGRYQAQNIVNTLVYRIVDQAVSELNVLTELLDQWDTNIKAGWLARHLDTYELVGLKAFNKTGPAKTPAFLSIGTAGSVVGEEIPSPVCRTITLYTASTNHRRRGRVMLSGTAVAQIDTDDGSVTTAEIALLDVLGTLLIAPLGAAGDTFQLGIGSTDILNFEDAVDAKGRETPSIVTSRRIRQFLIG